MKYLTPKEEVLFVSDKEQKVVLEIWNERTDAEIPMVGYVDAALTVKCAGEFFNKKDFVGAASANENPDIVHQIEMKAGDEISASYGKENSLRYQISDYDTWYAEERRKIDEKLYGPK